LIEYEKVLMAEKPDLVIVVGDVKRPLKNAQFCSSSRKAKILTAGIYRIFRGLKFEPDTEIGQKGTFLKGLTILSDHQLCNHHG